MQLAPIPALLLGAVLVFCSWMLVQRVLRPRLSRIPEPPPFPYQYAHLMAGVALYFGISLLIGGLLFEYYGGGERAKLEDMPPLVPLVATAITQALVVFGILYFLQRLRALPGHLGLADPSPVNSLVRGLAMYACCLPGLFGSLLIWQVLLEGLGYPVAQQDVAKQIESVQGAGRIVAFILAGAVIPFLEELLFRGFIQNWLVRLRGFVPGLVGTSLLFAALHGVTPFGYLIVVALAAGLALQWTGSLWAAVGVHAANNAINVLLLYFVSSQIP